MNLEQLKARYRRKTLMHILFQIGGAVVILGALFKILHLELGPINGSLVLGIGLITEAVIFFVGGIMLDDVKEEQAEFVKSQLDEKEKSSSGGDVGLTERIDAILEEAKLDVNLVSGLAENIKKLEEVSRVMSALDTQGTASNLQNFTNQLEKGASNLEVLNEMYNSQIESSNKLVSYNEAITENIGLLKIQKEILTKNLASLNEVYEGMLTAMNKK